MGERAAYSRVYWSIVDDPKFVTIYDSDAHLAAWLRLLLIADQAHPASAHLPSNVRRLSVAALAGVELIDLLPGHRYRVHGLDAERLRRRDAATSRPPTERVPNGPPNGPRSDTTGVRDTGPKTRRDEGETRRDETNARGVIPEDDDRADLEAFLLINRRAPTERQRQLLDSVLGLHDLSGPQWAAGIMLAHPNDPIGAVIAADKAWRAERIERAKTQEKPPIAKPRKIRGLTGINAELAELLRDAEARRAEPS